MDRMMSFGLDASRCGNKTRLTVSGVVCITDYNIESVSIKCHGGKIRVCGSDVRLNVLGGNVIEIVGRVGAIIFEDYKS